MIERLLRPQVLEALGDTRVVLVMGARQVGKSTLCESLAANEHPAESVSMDDKATREVATADPVGFLAGFDGPVFIDEVQRVPDLILAIKRTVDRDKQPGRFLLSGSANILASRKVQEALTGRIELLRLWPFAQAELSGGGQNIVDALFAASPPRIGGAPVGRAAFADKVAAGGYPEIHEREANRRDRWFESYLTTTFERDLRAIATCRRDTKCGNCCRCSQHARRTCSSTEASLQRSRSTRRPSRATSSC